MSASLFPALLEFQWRQIGVPVVETKLELRQDLVIHKFADRDGAHVEGLGRHPFQITARIPFINGLQKGQQESWDSESLYPDLWRGFFAAMADNSVGTLQHPELGNLTCKAEHCSTVWSAVRRGGVDVEASWIESDDEGASLSISLSQPSPLAGLQASAAAMDQQIADIMADPDAGIDVYDPPVTISSLVSNVIQPTFTLGFGAPSLSIQFSQCAAIIYQAQTVQASLNANSNALSWPLMLSCDIAIEAARNTQATLVSQAKPVKLYTVGQDSTLGMLASVIPANVSDLINLNQALCSNPIVPTGTVVSYYSLT